MNEKIKELTQKVSGDEDLLIEISKIDDLKSLYNRLKSISDGFTLEEFSNFIKKYSASINKNKLQEKELCLISGGNNNMNKKILSSIMGGLSFLSLSINQISAKKSENIENKDKFSFIEQIKKGAKSHPLLCGSGAGVAFITACLGCKAIYDSMPYTVGKFSCEPFTRKHIVGMMRVVKSDSPNLPGMEDILLIPPTDNMSNATISAYCMWERANGSFGRPLNMFFPVYANGIVDTSIVIGACYERKDVPRDATILFSDERFRFYKLGKSETKERGIYIFKHKSDNNYLMPILDQTVLYQLAKKNQGIREGDGKIIDHNRMKRYDIREFYDNIKSDEDIDYDYYSPLE